MKALWTFFARLFGRKKNDWDGYDYGKPSAANDEIRDRNNV